MGLEADVSPCECMQRLRNFKTHVIGNFVGALGVRQTPGLGVFGVEAPEPEEFKEALEFLETGLLHYTEHCPWEVSPGATRLTERIEELKVTQPAQFADIMSGRFAEEVQDLTMQAEEFVWAAVGGLHKHTEGHKDTIGVLSPDDDMRNACVATLNNIESAQKKLEDAGNIIARYMSPPENAVFKLVELSNQQRENIKGFLLTCKNNPLDLAWKIDEFGKVGDLAIESLASFDQWTRDNWDAIKDNPEQMDKRAGGRDNWLWKIEENISYQQNPIAVFLDEEWANVCGRLKWKDKP